MTRCQDDWTGRKFKSSVNEIESVVNQINAQITETGGALLNDFYDRLNIEPVGAGVHSGWEAPIDVRFSPMLTRKGKLILSISFHTNPTDVRAWTR